LNETETVYGLIYCATNKVNGKKYIGKTTKSLEERKKRHLENVKYDKYHFHNAIKKYGEESFIWEVLQDNIPNFMLDTLETYWIDYFDTFYGGYNSTSGGDGGIRSEETKKKISIANRGENHGMFGKRQTQEAIKRIREAQVGRTGEKHPMFGRTGEKHPMFGRTGEKHPKSKPVICLETNQIFVSATEASQILNINNTNISAVCRGKLKKTGGLHFTFYTKQQQEQSS